MVYQTSERNSQPISTPAKNHYKPLSIAILTILSSHSLYAADSNQTFNIPPQNLSGALNRYADIADVQLSYPASLTAGLKSSAVYGSFSPPQALDKLLNGTGFEARKTENGTITLVKGEIINPEEKTLPTTVKSANPTILAPVSVTATAEKEINPADDPYNLHYNRTNATAATKTDTPIMETPISIQVIPKAVLSDKQTMSLPDAVNGHVSGVLGRTGGGPLYDNFIIRGLPGSGFGDAYRNGLFNRQDIYDIANIQQIEILKGPAAVLYGRIEPGGLINYVTKKPLDIPYYSLQQQFGSYDQYRTLIDATGPIDKNKTILYRFNGSYTDQGSFRDNVSNERVFIAPSLSWRPNEKFEANLDIEYKHDRFNADIGIPAIGNRPAPIPDNRTLKDGGQRQLVESTLLGFDWTYHFNDNWKITQRYLFKDWLLTGPTLFNGGLQTNNRLLNRSSSIFAQSVMTHSGNIDLNGKFNILGSKHNLLLGVDGFRAYTEAPSIGGTASAIDIFNPVYGQVNFDALTTYNNFFYRKESWLGVYLQDQITLFDKLHILLGGRYDTVTTGSQSSPVSMEKAQAARIARDDEAFSPRAGLVYQIQNWLSVYGSYTESFSSNNGVSARGTNFEPQRGQQYEVGIKTESPDKLFSSTLAFFELTKSNLLTDDPNEADPKYQILAGKIRSKGIELDLAGQVTENLNLLATYAYTDASYVQSFSGLKGNRLDNVPKHQGSVWGTWQFNNAFKVGLGVVAVGSRPGDTNNSYILPGYARMDAMAAYTHHVGKHNLTFQLNINNLLDKDYYSNATGGRNAIIPGSPISVVGSVKYEF